MWQWLVEHGEDIREFFRAVVQIGVLWFLFYQIYRVFHATRGARIMMGLVMCVVIISALVALFGLKVLAWLMGTIVLPAMGVALVVIFQPELRTALAKLGSKRIFRPLVKLQQANDYFMDDFCKSVSALSNKHCGALFAFERGMSLKGIEETGVMLDALFSPELTLTIFHTKTALHDGGMVIANSRIVAAACVFPVSQKEMKDRTLGLRHRAGVGMTEENDCVVVIVSEETGSISLAVGGALERNLDVDKLRERLEKLLNIQSQSEVHEEVLPE